MKISILQTEPYCTGRWGTAKIGKPGEEEENKFMAYAHQILDVNMENERKYQIKPDWFSTEEIDH